MKVFHYGIIFLSECKDSALVGIFKLRHVVFLGQFFISSAGLGGNVVAVGDISYLALHKWFGDNDNFWPFGLILIFIFSLFHEPTQNWFP